MATNNRQPIYRRRGTDHLGFLGAKLRDLLGYHTLAHELIQNADDAEGATEMWFDVRENALIVDNNGVFSDCGALDDGYNCKWKREDPHKRMCDFHRFQNVAIADKRDELGTTGAFGIGFTAVYQITDQPELISAGRHWIIREHRQESERIEECPECSVCTSDDLPGTRFILPWARDDDSDLRRRLRVNAISSSTPTDLLKELLDAIPLAMLFLKRLQRISISKEGKTVRTYERYIDLKKREVIISDGTSVSLWFLFQANFQPIAKELRERYPERIEEKRIPQVTVAVPEEHISEGVFCAFLPTNQKTGLPLHINADFFTTSNRKEIVLEADYQSEWNRAAIKAGAYALARDVERLRDCIGHKQLWHLLESAWVTAKSAKRGERDRSLAGYWEQLVQVVDKKEIIYTSTGEWTTPTESFYLEQKEERDVVPILESLGLNVIHKDLRFAQNLLLSEAIKVPILSAIDVARALQNAGLNERKTRNELPEHLRSDEGIKLLWQELDILLAQYAPGRKRAKEDKEKVILELQQCTLAPASDDAFWPCKDVYRADSATTKLFLRIDSSIPFLVGDCEGLPRMFDELCPCFDCSAAVSVLERLGSATIRKAIGDRRLNLEILEWFADRRAEIRANPDLIKTLRELPLYPSSDGPRTLDELALPGDFIDPLGLANVVDVEAIGQQREFLRDLGAKELTFEHYAENYAPRAFQEKNIDVNKRRQAVRLLANELGRIRDNDDIRDVLRETPIVECEDGRFRHPAEVYLPDDVVTTILGSEIPIARIPEEYAKSLRAFYEWLGIEYKPRLSDVVDRIKDLTSKPPCEDSIRTIQILFEHLGKRVESEGVKDTEDALLSLKTERWLPAQGRRDRWYQSEQLAADFGIRHLCESQVLFIDIPYNILRASSELVEILGIARSPTVNQVVAHVLDCAKKKTPLHRDIYRWLNDQAEDQAIRRLINQPCLMLPCGTYVSARDVFWQEHPFGRFRHRLSEELRRYNDLFSRLGVREYPDYNDALSVIKQIADDYGSSSRLDEETRGVLLNCWKMLSEALEEEKISREELRGLSQWKVIYNRENMLYPPQWMFFDDRPGLAAKFGPGIENNAIERPQAAWRAMAVSGVRPLSEAVTAHLVECQDPVEDNTIIECALQRKDQLRRVLDLYLKGADSNLDKLASLRYMAVKELQVQYTLHAFKREWTTKPEPVAVHFLRDDLMFYFVRRNGEPSWPTIARELATILIPEIDPGQIAFAIKDVIAAETADKAASILDELGIPRLDTDDMGKPTASEIRELGESRDLDEYQTQSGGVAYGDTTTPSGGPSTVQEAIETILGPDTPSPKPPPAEHEKSESNNGRRSSSEIPMPRRSTHETKAARKGYSRLRSYVLPDSDGKEQISSEEVEHRSAVDEAGIKRVVEYERKQGRTPKVMPHTHPGYDIESYDGEDARRYIEVKSLSGDWGDFNAGLTDTQFNEAMRLRDKYWLYIVERAGQPDYRIHRIQDPAYKVNQFLFDAGWQAVTEEDPAAG
ncbi:MAG TPA: DUF3883 domain-containing protein [Nitrospirae bacterium]|nr:MAG: hypothetical protein AXA67_08090 [Methylothermaceae bacteria B42]HEB74924.1 DUF3883 domain-containing protein [Nitrospirota bacterium]